jgi:hypothetical protein
MNTIRTEIKFTLDDIDAILTADRLNRDNPQSFALPDEALPIPYRKCTFDCITTGASVSQERDFSVSLDVENILHSSRVRGGRFVVAGGYITIGLHRYGHSNDIDFFYVGPHEDANDSLDAAVRYVIEHTVWTHITLGENALTVYGDVVYQFIFRVYPTIAHILAGFDIPVCAIAYDGQFHFNDISLLCFMHRFIIFDASRASRNYLHRLEKYSNRLFTIVFPHFDIEMIYSLHGSEISLIDKLVRSYSDDKVSDDKVSDIIPLDVLAHYITRGCIHCYIYEKNLTIEHRRKTIGTVKRLSPTGNIISLSDIELSKSCELTVYSVKNFQFGDGYINMSLFADIPLATVTSSRQTPVQPVPKYRHTLRIHSAVKVTDYCTEKKYDSAELAVTGVVPLYIMPGDLTVPTLDGILSIHYDIILHNYKTLLSAACNGINYKGCLRRTNVARYYGLLDSTFDELDDALHSCEDEETLAKIKTRVYEIALANYLKNRNVIDWTIKNPGRQWTSSFNPVNYPPSYWYGQLYKLLPDSYLERLQTTVRFVLWHLGKDLRGHIARIVVRNEVKNRLMGLYV